MTTRSQKNRQGITLIETVVYVALLGVLSVGILSSVSHVAIAYRKARAERDILVNARLLIDTVVHAAQESQTIYAPTSRFDTDASQLSLVSAVAPLPGHAVSYVDFWVDNGRLWMKSEGAPALALSSPTVRVTRFYLQRLAPQSASESVRMTISLAHAWHPNASSTLITTATLRGNY